jgi:hypothetical protein
VPDEDLRILIGESPDNLLCNLDFSVLENLMVCCSCEKAIDGIGGGSIRDFMDDNPHILADFYDPGGPDATICAVCMEKMMRAKMHTT